MSEEIKVDDTVDVTDVKCPTTFVKAKVAIEELESLSKNLTKVRFSQSA